MSDLNEVDAQGHSVFKKAVERAIEKV
jgi:hypothetical protein